MSAKGEQLRMILERLTGEAVPLTPEPAERGATLLTGSGMGYSQMNELLLLLGYDRISSGFFQYLLNGAPDYSPGSAAKSIEELKSGVERFVKHALFRFGNVKYAFKHMSRLNEHDLRSELEAVDVIDDQAFTRRHDPVQPIEPIPGEDTYYLGYLVERELEARRVENPNDPRTVAELTKRKELVARGTRNQQAYLTSDYMDVYVATSMRERHEYYFASQITFEVFSHPRLKPLKLRWFDPTQAYCLDRLDKGLSEALMLKRAKCTLYLAQETDTLGKDSELASTLAQGKPVIAYLPELTEANQLDFVERLLKVVQKLEGTDLSSAILAQLRLFAPEAAWQDPGVRAWANAPTSMDIEQAKKRLAETIRRHYDKRADTLKKAHPLGIQVNLETGVANGVIVARSIDQCAELIYRVVTARLEFEIEERLVGERPYLLLHEKVSGSIVRVVTGDPLLTNAFWNFYLKRQ